MLSHDADEVAPDAQQADAVAARVRRERQPLTGYPVARGGRVEPFGTYVFRRVS